MVFLRNLRVCSKNINGNQYCRFNGLDWLLLIAQWIFKPFKIGDSYTAMSQNRSNPLLFHIMIADSYGCSDPWRVFVVKPLVPMIPMSDSLFDQFDHQGESFLIRWEDEDTWSPHSRFGLGTEGAAPGNPWTWWKVKRFLCKVWGPVRACQSLSEFRELCWEMLETEQIRTGNTQEDNESR